LTVQGLLAAAVLYSFIDPGTAAWEFTPKGWKLCLPVVHSEAGVDREAKVCWTVPVDLYLSALDGQ